MARCKGTRRDGNRCKNTKVMDNGYCFSHQSQAPNKKLKIKKLLIKAILPTMIGLLSIYLTIHFGLRGATKEDLNILLEQHESLEKRYADEFLSKYNLGYCLLAIDRNKKRVSKPKVSIAGFKINWSTFDIIEYVPGSFIIIETPSIIAPHRVIIGPDKFKLPTNKGASSHSIFGEVRIDVEVVSEIQQGIFILLGLSRFELPRPHN